MSVPQPSRSAPDPTPGFHLATVAHEGLIWDAYLEFETLPEQPRMHRARIRFNQAGSQDAPVSTQTTIIIIEESYEDAVAKARSLDDRQLQNLLRSTLPDPA